MSRERIIYSLVQEKFFDYIIKNASTYIRRAALMPERNVEMKVGGWTHKEQIDQFLNLIEFFIVNSKKSNLEFHQISAIFDAFVRNAVTDYEISKFFIFLTKENENGATRERRYLLDEKRRN